ncbi:MAG: hypothetical protein IPM57_06065 [Oligoflexia bacterium]|nr:hypothetical protein [Oligoflexia bacterium]
MRKNRNDQFLTVYGHCQRQTESFRNESIRAAQEIYNASNHKLALFLSGGIDSEFMANAFYFANIPFKAIIIRFKNDLNIHDISWAIMYCEAKQIPYQIYDLDVLSFLNGKRILELSKITASASPVYLWLIHVATQLIRTYNIKPVFGCGDLNLTSEMGKIFLLDDEMSNTLFRYFYKMKLEAVTDFFIWSPELMFSYLTDKKITAAIIDKNITPYNNLLLKYEIYNEQFNMQKRPKYTGYEKFLAHYLKTKRKLLKNYVSADSSYRISYSKLVSSMRFREK